MPSTYSDRLRLELMATGEKSGTWGDITNTNLGTLLEDSIAGWVSVTHSDAADYTLTTNNGSADEARNMILNIGGTLTAARNVVCPTEEKLYVIKNATSGGYAVTIKTSGGSGISIPNGKTTVVYCDGTNVVDGVNYLSSLVTDTITSNSTTATVYNTVATTVNAFGAATTLNIGNASGTTTILGNTLLSANTAGNALEIRQTGAGNALLIEDSANPDSTPFVIDASGNVVVGHTAAIDVIPGTGPAAVGVYATGGAGSSVSLANFGTSTAQSTLYFSKARGGTITATPTTLVTADPLGRLDFAGYVGTTGDWVEAASIEVVSTGTVSDATNGLGAYISFSTRTSGSAVTEAVRINASQQLLANTIGVLSGTTATLYNTTATTVNAFGAATTLTMGASAGRIGLGVAAPNYSGFYVAQTITSGGASTLAAATLFGSSLTGASGDTSYLSQMAVTGAITTQGATESIGQVSTLRLAEPSIIVGTGDTITTAATLYIVSAPTEGSTNAAIWSSATAAANVWNIYASGTAKNYFAGDLEGAASMNVFNSGSTTVNAFGAATTLTMGGATGTLTLNNPTVQGSSGNALTLQSQSGRAIIFNTNGATQAARLSSTGEFIVSSYAGSPTGGNWNIEASGTANDGIALSHFATTSSTVSQDLVFYRSNNASVGSHTVVAQDDQLGRIIARGSNGASYMASSYIAFHVDGVVTASASDMPGRISFWTSPDGSATPAERLRIDSAGASWFGSDVHIGFTGANPWATYTSSSAGSLILKADPNNAYASSTFTLTIDGTTRMSIDNAGALVMQAPASTGAFNHYITNSATTVSSYVALNIGNIDSSTTGALRLVALGTSWTTSSAYLQDAGAIVAATDLSNGLSIGTQSTAADAAIRFYTNNLTLRMTLSKTGQVGLGVVPSTTWASVVDTPRALQIGSVGFLAARNSRNEVLLGDNSVHDGSVWKYSTSSKTAGVYQIDETECHSWWTAPAGTAGNTATFTERMKLSEPGTLYVGDTANANMTVGLTINQGANDNTILSLKSSDVSTNSGSWTPSGGIAVEPDDFLSISKQSATDGGMVMQVMQDDGTQNVVFGILAIGGQAATSDTTTSDGLVRIRAAEHDGVGGLVTNVANSNLMTWQSWTGAAWNTRMLLKADDGELHLGNTTLVALDDEDDALLVRAFQKESSVSGIIQSQWDNPFYDYHKLRSAGLVGEKDERGEFLFPLQPRLAVHEGAIWQNYTKLKDMERRISDLAAQNMALEAKLALLEHRA